MSDLNAHFLAQRGAQLLDSLHRLIAVRHPVPPAACQDADTIVGSLSFALRWTANYLLYGSADGSWPLLRRIRRHLHAKTGDRNLADVVAAVLLAERLRQVATDVRLYQADLARILGASPRTVARWLQAETAPRRDTRERILELVAVLDALSRTVHGQSAYDWLNSPIPALEHRKPADLLAEGRYREVLAAIDAPAEGVSV